MNYTLKKVFLMIIMILCFFQASFSFQEQLTIYHPSYFGEQNNIFESIHYLENEILSFEVCPNEKVEISSKVICSSGEEISIELFENEDSCYYGNKNFDEISCNDFTLSTSYSANEKERTITRDFEQEKESKLLNHILEKNYNNLDSLELSYYLLTLNKVQSQITQETVDAYEKLKNDRDNSEKCWPKNNCDLLTTAKILNNINLAEYPDDSRLIEDGKIFFESKILDNEEIEFSSTATNVQTYEIEIKINHEFGSSEEIECDMNLDFGEEERTYIFDEDSDLEELRIYKNAQENVDFSCDSDVDKLIVNTYEETISQDFSSNEDRINFQISNSDLNDFSEFNLEIEVKHNFAPSEEIQCTLEIDGDEADYTFDEDSNSEDFIINEIVNEEFDFDCDNNIDELYYIIYGGDYDTQEEGDANSIEYEISNLDSDVFDFILYLSYDFENEDETLSCQITTDDTTRTQNYQEDDVENGKIIIDKYSTSKSIGISCDKKIDELEYEILDKFQRVQISDIEENIASKSISIPDDFSKYSCISKNKNCDFETTLFSSYLIDSSSKNKVEMENFLKSYTTTDSNDLRFIDDSSKRIELSGKFLYFFKDPKIEDSLKFIQNNDGSWGDKNTNEKIIETTWASMGLAQNTEESEYLEDARKWIYFNEPVNGWGSVEKDTLAYLTIEEQIKPYLKISTINQIDESIKVTIENPTIFSIKNIEIDFGDELNNKLAFKQTIEELNQNEKEEINITILGGVSGIESGTLTVRGYNNKKEIEFVTIPISLNAPFPFKLATNEVSVIEGDIYTKIPITAEAQSFSNICTITNPFENRNEQSTITQDTKEIQLSNILQKTGEYTLEINCKDDSGKTFSKQETFTLTKIGKTFEVDNENINLFNIKNDFPIAITNLADDKQTINVEIEGEYAKIIEATEASKILALNETREIYFSVLDYDLLSNLSQESSGKIILSSGDYKKEINLYLASEIIEETSFPWIWIIVGIIIVFLSLIVIRRYNQMKLENDENGDGQHEEDDLFLDEDVEFK